MKRAMACWGAAALVIAALAGCGGSSSGGTSTTPAPQPPSSAALAQAIGAAAAVAANDTSTNQTAPFAVLQGAGLPAVAVGPTVTVNFTVFSDGAVKTGLTTADVSVAIARLIPSSDGNPAEWTSYVSRKATATAGPGGAVSPPATAMQATTDPKTSAGQLVYNSAGYYTYTFTADITNPEWSATLGGVQYSTNGVAFVSAATQRVALQLIYKNAAGEIVRVNPYFDFTFAAAAGGYSSTPLTNPATQDSQVSVISSCNTCHDRLALHGGGAVATQYCVMCHNPGTTDPDSGNVLTFSTMTHKIHAGRLLAEVPGGEDYTIWGFRGTKYDFSDVGYPQDLRNCSVCHTSSNPATPQGDNWKSQASQEACLTCHASNTGSAWEASHSYFASVARPPVPNAKDLTNAQCLGCHGAGTTFGADTVHWPQEQVNQALYKMNIESVTFNDAADKKGRTVTVKYYLSNPTDGNKPYRLSVTASECTTSGGTLSNCSNAKFGNLRAYLAYQNIVGQPSTPTEFSSYNNGGSGAYACLYEGPATTSCPRTAVNDGSNRYTVTIPLPDDTPTQVANGTAMVVTVGQIKEVKQQATSTANPRPPVTPTVLVNTAVQHSSAQVALSGSLQPVAQVVSDQACNVCHAVLGTASGSNTMANAFHNGARNMWQSCLVCHDANRSSSTVMTNGLTLPDGSPMREQYQFGYMIHGIHGNSKRFTPYTNGNTVFGKFDKDCRLVGDPNVTCSPGTTNFAQTTRWPGPTVDGQKQLNCTACHVGSSYAESTGTLGAVVSTRPTGSNPLDWNVITPKAASCVSCHNSDFAVNHVLTAGNSRYGNATQAVSLQINETCADCHSPTGFLSVKSAHNLK